MRNKVDIGLLVVKDANVIINWIKYYMKKIGIIVLKDNYNTNSDYIANWNVYVTSNVSSINAIIYADWWFISANSSWIPYTTDSTSRSIELNNQLFMKWSLFTRNTIGWGYFSRLRLYFTMMKKDNMNWF